MTAYVTPTSNGQIGDSKVGGFDDIAKASMLLRRVRPCFAVDGSFGCDLQVVHFLAVASGASLAFLPTALGFVTDKIGSGLREKDRGRVEGGIDSRRRSRENIVVFWVGSRCWCGEL